MTQPPPQWPAGKLLEQGRITLGISKAEAARRSGLSESWWRRLESGTQYQGGHKVPITPTPEALSKAAQAVDVPITDILTAAGITIDTMDTRDLIGEANRLLKNLPLNLQREALAFIRGLSIASR